MIYTLDYYSPRALTTTFGDSPIKYYSKPGIPNWDTVPPAFHLLANHAFPKPHDHVWCINCGPGALAAVITTLVPSGSCLVSADEILSLTCTELMQKEHNIRNLIIDFNLPTNPTPRDNIDLILMGLSKGRGLNRRWLRHTWQALKTGGRMLIAGAKEHGVQSILNDAEEIFHNISILAYKKGNRVAQFIKADHKDRDLPQWAFESGIPPETWHLSQIQTSGVSIELVSLPGVFSYANLDEGTNLLLLTLGDFTDKKVLDIGCGSGIIGIFAAKRGASNVDMVDSQLLAIAACQENIKRNKLNNCQAYCSDLLSAVRDNSYSFILSNPPFHTGYQVNYQVAQALISSAYIALEPNGWLQIVANRFIRYDHLMAERFGNVKILDYNSAFHVLASKKEQV